MWTPSPSSSSRISWLRTTNCGRPPGPVGPAQAQLRTLGEDPGEVSLVEPHGLDGAGGVAHERLHHAYLAARRAVGAHALDDAAHRRLLVDAQIADLLALAEVVVAPRVVTHEVADGHEPEPLEAAGDGRGDALERGERRGESGRVEGEPRGGRPAFVPAAPEAQRECLPGHSTISAKAVVPGPMWVPTTAPTRPRKWKCALGRTRLIISSTSAISSALSASMRQ